MCEFIACEGFMHVFEKARMPYICIWGWGLVCQFPLYSKVTQLYIYIYFFHILCHFGLSQIGRAHV